MITTPRSVADRDDLDDLLERRVQIHGRCCCGHVTSVTPSNAILVEAADPA